MLCLSVLDRYIFDEKKMCENKLFYFRKKEMVGKGWYFNVYVLKVGIWIEKKI